MSLDTVLCLETQTDMLIHICIEKGIDLEMTFRL